jgi:hypothetical protein
MIPGTSAGRTVFAILVTAVGLVMASTAMAAPLSQEQVDSRVRSGDSGPRVLVASYPGSRLARRTPKRRLRVLVADLAPSVVVQSRTRLRLRDMGAPRRRPATLIAGHRYQVTREGAAWRVADLDDPAAVRTLAGAPRFQSRGASSGILMAEPLDVRYRGDLELLPSGDAIRVVNVVRVEDWVPGVLAGEVPGRWLSGKPQSIWAAAVLARSRGLRATSGKARRGSHDLTSDDPLYLGIDGERAASVRAVRRSRAMALFSGATPVVGRFPAVRDVSPAFRPDPGNPDPVARARAKPVPGAPVGVGGDAVALALEQRGTPYLWGGATPGGFDCSGLVYWAYAQFGLRLPRVAADQAKVGFPVARDELMPGDAVFFADSSGYIHHEGLYVGNGAMVHAPRTGDVVRVQTITSGYYARQYAGARRYSPTSS